MKKTGYKTRCEELSSRYKIKEKMPDLVEYQLQDDVKLNIGRKRV